MDRRGTLFLFANDQFLMRAKIFFFFFLDGNKNESFQNSIMLCVGENVLCMYGIKVKCI